MDIRNFVTFNTVVEAEGFTKAAHRLNYAQSTVTLHIKELEKHYGEPLFDRMGKKIYLTHFGKSLYKKSSRMTSEYEAVLDMNVEAKTTSVLRVGVYESLLRYRMYDLIHEFKMKYPNVDMIIQHGTCRSLRRLVREGELDLTFLIEPQREFSNMKAMILCEEKFSLIFPQNGGMETLHKKNQTVYLTEKECSYRIMFEDFLNARGVVKQHTMETGSVDMIKQYVSFGLGYSMVPSVTVENETDSSDLTVIPFNNDVPMYTQIVYHKEKHIFKAMAGFIELVEKYSNDW